MKQYLKAQSKKNEIVINGDIGYNEIQRFSTADYRWAERRKKTFTNQKPKKGEIYQFEFGKNYIPEMSYEHRGLVIGVKEKLLYVLPIFSYHPNKHTSIYHPDENPKADLYFLKSEDYSFIQHDSVLKLNDIRTVSIHRLLYSHKGTISPSSKTYKEIETLVLKKYFPSFQHEYEETIQENRILKQQLNTPEKKLPYHLQQDSFPSNI